MHQPESAHFAGRVVVTGAGRGIGRAIAELFAHNGASVVAVDGGLLSQQRAPQVDILPLELYPTIDKDSSGTS